MCGAIGGMFEAAITKKECDREKSKEGPYKKAHRMVAALQNNCALFTDRRH
jgi:hypothetical protein